MDLTSFLPARSMEDILSERIRLTIGGEEYILPVLVIDENSAWLGRIDADFAALMSALSNAGDDVATIVALLTRDPDWLIDHLLSYDKGGVLPDRVVIRKHMTPVGLLKAVGEVWRAANPLADIGIAVAMTDELPTNVSPMPTSSSRRRTGGTRRTSASA